ncbi:ChrR family anti-sigma-E factor [Rhodocista pekingensis]|uniref:ChrR family anti-sigma-E factor n=1 Tax=Rhodocista pekingensis TaxID=201185 RepID=A0ABW2KQP7_9PROT
MTDQFQMQRDGMERRRGGASPVQYHPGDDLLVAYAAGSLPEAMSLIVATHLALCPHCRAEVRRLEAVGGALLEEMPAAPVSDALLDAVMARLDAPGGDTLLAPPPAAGLRGTRATATRSAAAGAIRRTATAPVLPEPLRSYVGRDLGGLSWTRIVRGVEEVMVPCGGDAKVKLMRIHPGIAVPRHTHRGSELTLVLQGGYRDGGLHYLRGDFAATDAEVDHGPVADSDGECICIAVTDAPLRLTGPFGRLLNPFIRS